MINLQNKYKDVIVQYEGGGYDGCIWEYNFGYFDSRGNFKSLFNSGSMGITGQVAMIEHMENKENTVYITDVTDQNSVNEFTRETNPDMVKMVAHRLYEYNQIILEGKCPICNDLVDLTETVGIEEQGQGGIVIANTNWDCDECYGKGLCGHCGEYVPHNLDENRLCGYCSIEDKKEYLKELMSFIPRFANNDDIERLKDIEALKVEIIELEAKI